jgi:hypothetical protein
VRATEGNIRGGADVIKLHGGLSLEEYKAIVEVADRHHVKVHAHVYQELEVRDAFSAGVDVLQHAGSGMPPFNAALVWVPRTSACSTMENTSTPSCGAEAF